MNSQWVSSKQIFQLDLPIFSSWINQIHMYILQLSLLFTAANQDSASALRIIPQRPTETYAMSAAHVERPPTDLVASMQLQHHFSLMGDKFESQEELEKSHRCRLPTVHIIVSPAIIWYTLIGMWPFFVQASITVFSSIISLNNLLFLIERSMHSFSTML